MSSTTVEGNHQVASFLYLEPDPRHEKEKPYKLRYEPGEGIPRSNVSNEKQDGIVVRDVRNEEQESLAERGYTWVNLQSALSPDEFYDETKVKEIYYAELRGLLQKLLNPKRIEILEHNCRKRHEKFPVFTGQDYQYLQPTTIVHLDYTVGAAEHFSTTEFGIPRNGYGRMECYNLWKPLRGPVKEWPLALCDPRSVKPESDVVAVDVVSRESYTENAQLYYRPTHKWVYISNQLESEVAVFRQIDTARGEGTGVPHSSFQIHGTGDETNPRESIEVRAFLYYDDDDLE